MGGSAALSQGSTKWNPPASSQASSVTITQALSRQAPWMQQAFSRLDELKQLAPDWDGYKSPKITDQALASAEVLLNAINREDLTLPRILPVSGGGIALEWKLGSRSVDFEILPSGVVEYLRAEESSDRSGSTTEEGDLSVARLYEARFIIEWLVGIS
jgi:hypothetical protein